MYRIDLNSDLGESFGAYKIGMDDKIIPLISSANVRAVAKKPLNWYDNRWHTNLIITENKVSVQSQPRKHYVFPRCDVSAK